MPLIDKHLNDVILKMEGGTMTYTPRDYIAMALACGSQLDLGNATQVELDALVQEYLRYLAHIGRN